MKKYLTPEDYKIAESNGIPKKLAYQRFYLEDWSAERAITQPRQRNISKWVEIAKRNGISKSTFYHRVSKRMGWSPYKAATTPVNKRGEFMSVEEQFFGGAG